METCVGTVSAHSTKILVSLDFSKFFVGVDGFDGGKEIAYLTSTEKSEYPI